MARPPKERYNPVLTVRLLNCAIFVLSTLLFYAAARRLFTMNRRRLDQQDSLGIASQSPSLLIGNLSPLSSAASLFSFSRKFGGKGSLTTSSPVSAETAESIRETTAALQVGIANRAPADLVMRGDHRGPRQMCSYSEDEVRQIVALPHKCGFKNNRYYYKGQWITWWTLHGELNPADKEAAEGGHGAASSSSGNTGARREDVIECVLACKYHPDLRCSAERPCLHAFHLRHNSTDTRVLRQLYEWGEHQFLKPRFKFDTILDAGANIGLASVLFANMYPQALIVSVEASSRNFRMLRLNTQPYPNIVPVNVALWPRVAPLSLIVGPRNPDLPPEWGYMVRETSELKPGQPVEASLTGVSVSFIIRALGIQAFDFLKVDIEGSEGEFFKEGQNHSLEWVDRGKLVALELHGDMVPGSNVTVLNYFARKENFLHKTDWSGEYEVFMRKDSGLLS